MTTQTLRHVDVPTLIRMDDDGTLHAWATRLKADFDQFVRTNRDTLIAADALFAVVDTTDFLLRVLEDDAVRDDAFKSGQDDRVPHYLNLALAVTSAPTREAAINVLRPGHAE